MHIQHLKYLPRYSNNYKHSAAPPPPVGSPLLLICNNVYTQTYTQLLYQSDYGKAGIFSNSMINQYKELTDKLTEDLPDYGSPTPGASQSNVVSINRRS